MSSTGNVFAGAGATVDRAGSTLWTNPGNITSDNATNATSTVPTDYLVASSFGFSSSVPANVAIRGITVRVEMAETGTGSSNYVVQLSTDTTPTLVGNASGTITVTTGPTISTTGGIADLWGTTLTAAQVRAAGFGVTLWSTDTINALQCDFITIAIEWTDVPNAWDARRDFKFRRNSTNRKRRDALLNSSNPSTPAMSVDRALDAGFLTTVLRSRRSLSVGWISAMASAVTPVPPVPVSAWIVPVPRRRRETERTLVKVEPLHWPYIAPVMAPLLSPPKVIRVEFRRKLQAQAAQLELPQATGPPSADRALAAAFVTVTLRSRRLQRLPETPVYPATPAAAVPLPAWVGRQLPATSHDRRLLRVPEHDVYPGTPKPEPNLCARLQLGFRKRRATERRLLSVKLDRYAPPVVAEASDDRALRASFVTRQIRSRRLQRPRPFVVAGVAEPPALSPGVVPAFTLTKAKRRKHRQGLFLSGGGVVEGRVTAQFPAYQRPVQLKRRDTQRKLRRLAQNPAYPATPAQGAVPVTAWTRVNARHVERKRTRRDVPTLSVFRPTTYAAPLSAVEPTGFHRRRDIERRLRKPLALNVYPTTPAVGAQPESAWRLQVARRSVQRRKLLPQAAQVTYPRTPGPYLETARALKRRDTKRTLRTSLHLPSYPQAPVPFQPPTAWKLAGVFRRFGWRRLRSELELDEFPFVPGDVGRRRFSARVEHLRFNADTERARFTGRDDQTRFDAE